MWEWLNREDFRARLPELLRGEDPDFAAHMMALSAKVPPHTPGEAGLPIPLLPGTPSDPWQQ